MNDETEDTEIEDLFEPEDEDDDTSCAICGEPRNDHNMMHDWVYTR
jgi:hypothetical protein